MICTAEGQPEALELIYCMLYAYNGQYPLFSCCCWGVGGHVGGEPRPGGVGGVTTRPAAAEHMYSVAGKEEGRVGTLCGTSKYQKI